MERTTLILGVATGVLGMLVAGLTAAQITAQGRMAVLEGQVAALTSDPQVEAAPTRRSGDESVARTRKDRPTAARAGEPAPVDREAIAKEMAEELGGDIDDPETAEKLERMIEETTERREQERREEWSNRMRESMVQGIREYGDDHDWDERTTEKVLAVSQETADTWQALRKELEAGEITFHDMRTEIRASRDEAETKLTELLGEDEYKALQEQMGWGGRGRW